MWTDGTSHIGARDVPELCGSVRTIRDACPGPREPEATTQHSTAQHNVTAGVTSLRLTALASFPQHLEAP